LKDFWEVTIHKKSLNFSQEKLVMRHAQAGQLSLYVRRERFEELPISLDHAIAAGTLDGKHKDPFDRMLIAQARSEKLTLISDDKIFKKSKIALLW